MGYAKKLSELATAYNTGSPLTHRNKIINGGMVFDQRNQGASLSASTSSFGVDRWQTYSSPASKYSSQQNLNSLTPPSRFKFYLGCSSSSAYSSASGDVFALLHNIEGFNVANLDWGTANAKTVTLSFWVRSSLTGTFGGSLTNNGYNRSYPFSYQISSANTWEYKTITVAGDTSGTWTSDNSAGIRLYIDLGSGSTYQGTAGSWGGIKTTVTGATSIVGTNGATFYLTGVQLEAGYVATNFEMLSYSLEELLCKRYYYKLLGGTTANIAINGYCFNTVQYNAPIKFPVEMRSAPSLVSTSGSGYYSLDTPSANALGSWSIYNASTLGALIYTSVASGAGGYASGVVNNASGMIAFNAEL